MRTVFPDDEFNENELDCDDEDSNNIVNFPNIIKNKAKRLMYESKDKFTLTNMTQQLDEILEKHTSSLPSQVQLKLPKLKKVGSSEPPKIKLPKLKKVTESAHANSQ